MLLYLANIDWDIDKEQMSFVYELDRVIIKSITERDVSFE